MGDVPVRRRDGVRVPDRGVGRVDGRGPAPHRVDRRDVGPVGPRARRARRVRPAALNSLPRATFQLPWDDAAAPDPVAALTAARASLGDTFVVSSGGTEYLFVFGADELRAFYDVPE